MTPRRGESHEEFRKRVNAAARQRYANGTAVAPDEVKVLRRQLDLRERELRELREQIREDELASSLRFKPHEIPVEAHEAKSPGYPVTLWSDWHWGEVVDARQVNGLNAFNREIAHQRVEALVNNTVKLLRDYAGREPVYPGIWVCLGGDLISGKIHEELRETNWGTVEEQAYEVGGALAGALGRMADEFGEVHVPCVVGNHGRNSIKPVAKNRVRENREWGVYKSLERHFAADTRFHFYIPDGPDYLFHVFGHRFFLTHGDALGTKGGDGIIGAIGPIKRGVVKIRGAEVPVGRDFDYLLCGHWHSYQPPGELFPVLVNGTLKGADEYALNILRVGFAKPSQSTFIVSPKHGLVHPEAVYL